ncbi:MAG TPA: hypothetical protein VFZ87_07550 [Gemmatimonadales bacterium]
MTRRFSAAAIPVGLTLALLVSRVAAVPPLSDPVRGTVSGSLTLKVPGLYLILAPVFTMWDGISMLSMTRLKGFLAGLLFLYVVWRVVHWVWDKRTGSLVRRWLRELGVLAASITLLLIFLVVGALWHRPMLSLAGTAAGERVVDFHSHTNVSHDVAGTFMKDFDAAADLRWHSRAGFDATFITDHNVASEPGPHGPGQSRVSSRESAGLTVPCPGIEVSAWRAHIVLLGDTLPVDRAKYNSSLESLLQLLGTSERAYGSLSVASLPEYRRNHWHRLDTLVGAGLDGFEIVNASPKANELTRAERDTVIALARAHDRFVLGVSDSHGWGATSMVWNLVPVPPATSPARLCRAVLDQLGNGFEAVRVIERHRLRPEAWWPMSLTPVGMVWETWRSMGWALTASWLLWIWLAWGVAHRRR